MGKYLNKRMKKLFLKVIFGFFFLFFQTFVQLLSLFLTLFVGVSSFLFFYIFKHSKKQFFLISALLPFTFALYCFDFKKQYLNFFNGTVDVM